MNNPQPSIVSHRDPGSTTHSKYSFSKTPRFPSNNAMYSPYHSVVLRPSIPFSLNSPTGKRASATARKLSFPASFPTPPLPIATASIPASRRPRDQSLEWEGKSHRTGHTWFPRSTSILGSERYFLSHSVLKPDKNPHGPIVLSS